MKRSTILAVSASIVFSAFTPLKAQQLLDDSFTRLRVHYETPAVQFDADDFFGEKLVYPIVEGYALGGSVGAPAVPYISSLLTVPFCDGFDIEVENALFDTVDLPLLGILPQQPPRSKSDTTTPYIVRDKEVYATDAYSGLPLASVDPIGIARDRNLAYLRFAPVSINPVKGKAVICRRADISVTYRNPDRRATISHYQRYHTPAFSAGQSLNSLGLSAKAGSNTPVRYTIITPSSLNCRRLKAFADWKRRQGMMVDIITTERSSSSARNELTPKLKDLYDNATATSPAPTYVLVIGDHEQLAAHNTQLPTNYYTQGYRMLDHISDLYYVTWTDGDYLPDAYYGRFSATDTVTLARIINKTMLYESYSFEDDSYLARAVLVSGIDQGRSGDNAYAYSDPTMDYAAQQYVNSNHGYTNVRYYKNRTSYAPSGVTVTGSSNASHIADTLRSLYNQGIGWINYSAHGDWNSWSIPLFNTSNASAMQNTGKPSVMIGNCCLSNKFDKGECLGEALLRRADNAGAVAYIGASQETYWTHDFYWSVGMRGSNEFSGTKVPTYSSTRLGMYDHLFHTHNEPFEKHGTNTGSMIYYGNMAVQSGATDETNRLFAQYYWEIYHVMGDASLMPWLGRAAELPFSADTSTTTSVRFTTVANAYVALVDSASLQLVGASYADATGYGEITIPYGKPLSDCFFTATAQGYRPYISGANGIDLGLNIDIRTYPNPADDHVNIVGTGIREVTLATPAGTVIATFTVGSDFYTLDLSNIAPGFYIIVVATDDGVSAQRLVRL